MKRLLTKRCHNLLYGGEFERPVATVNFWSKEFLELGLVHLPTKCKSLIMRTMYKEFLSKKIQIVNGEIKDVIYGDKIELETF